MFNRVSISLFWLTLFGCSCAVSKVKLDPQNAIEANDLTSIMSGSACGEQISVGYLVCRIPEGTDAKAEYFQIHAPPNIDCDDEHACVYFRVYFPNGRPTYEGVVKKGEAFEKIPMDAIINKPVFDLADRGFFGISVTIYSKGPSGMDIKTYSNGYLFLHVVKREYISLLENSENENFRWVWGTQTNQIIKLTTGGRVYVSPSENIHKSWLP